MIKYYYGISVKHFIYQGKTSGQKPSRQHLASSTLPKGKDPWAPADGEWTRGRDSNSHDRSCSTMHNLSATTRCATSCLVWQLYMVCYLEGALDLG